MINNCYVEEETDYTDTTWYEEEVAEQYFEGSELATLESGELELVEKGEDYVLQLTDEQWDTITYMDMILGSKGCCMINCANCF